jgi:hypothetical protein
MSRKSRSRCTMSRNEKKEKKWEKNFHVYTFNVSFPLLLELYKKSYVKGICSIILLVWTYEKFNSTTLKKHKVITIKFILKSSFFSSCSCFYSTFTFYMMLITNHEHKSNNNSATSYTWTFIHIYISLSSFIDQKRPTFTKRNHVIRFFRRQTHS